MAETKSPSIIELLKELEEARAAYNEADLRESNARSAKTTCVNRLNNAQKALDVAYAELKNNSPYDTGWARPYRGGNKAVEVG